MSDLQLDATSWLNAHAKLVEAEARIAARLNGAGMKPVAFLALRELHSVDGWAPQLWLRDRLSLSKASMSEILGRLLDKGYIQTNPPPYPEDQRVRNVFLTDEGRNLVESVVADD